MAVTDGYEVAKEKLVEVSRVGYRKVEKDSSLSPNVLRTLLGLNVKAVTVYDGIRSVEKSGV